VINQAPFKHYSNLNLHHELKNHKVLT